MKTYVTRIRNISIITGVIIIVLGLGWAITSYKSIFLGLLLGTAVSYFNSLYTAYKINQIGKMVTTGNRRRFATIGTSTRFATALLAAVIAIKFPQSVSMIGTIVGLLIVPMITLAEGFIALKKQNTSGERGEI